MQQQWKGRRHVLSKRTTRDIGYFTGIWSYIPLERKYCYGNVSCKTYINNIQYNYVLVTRII